MKNLLISAVVFITLLVSCNISGHLTKRYKSIDISENPDTLRKYIDISAYVIEKEKGEAPKSKTVFDLSPQAQAAFINELGKKESATDKFVSGLSAVLMPGSGTPSDIIDYSQFDKRIVVSVRNKSHIPSDRITKINITLDLGPEVKILSCNRLTTEYQTLDLAKLNYSNDQSAEISGNLSNEAGIESTSASEKTNTKSTGKIGAGLSGKLSSDHSFSEEILLKQRMVVLNAAINQNKLSLYQEGISGIDLTGNIIADVTLGIENLKVEKTYSFSELTKNSILNDPANIRINEKLIILPNISPDINATISFEADYRYVAEGDKTISESDDEVVLYYGNIADFTSEVIIPKKKLSPALWKLTFKDDADKLPVQIRSLSDTDPGDLLFNSFDTATDFVEWLKSKYDDKKKEIRIGNPEYIIQMPETFKTIRNIEIDPN